YLDASDAGTNGPLDVGNLVLGRHDPRLVLEPVAGTDLDDFDRRRHHHASPLEMSAPMSRAIASSGAGTSTIGSSRSSNSILKARAIVACISYINVMYVNSRICSSLRCWRSASKTRSCTRPPAK